MRPGYVNSLAHPGGNTTGVTNLTRELSGKRLELLNEIVPGLSRVGILWNVDAQGTGFGTRFKEYQAAAQSLKIPLGIFAVIRASNPDFDGGISRCCQSARECVLSRFRIYFSTRTENRLPSWPSRTGCLRCARLKDYADAGGLVSYSADDD